MGTHVVWQKVYERLGRMCSHRLHRTRARLQNSASCRCRQQTTRKYWCACTELHGIVSHKTVVVCIQQQTQRWCALTRNKRSRNSLQFQKVVLFSAIFGLQSLHFERNLEPCHSITNSKSSIYTVPKIYWSPTPLPSCLFFSVEPC